MKIEELKDYYKARVEPYWKSMNEILEEFAKETKAYKELEEENKKLKEEVKQLEERYDRNAELYKRLLEENKNLKSDLSECECSFWFENDEVWFWKREYKRLKKWIKDHCKWYWNLFPEDEMKRQWKKADKKRK